MKDWYWLVAWAITVSVLGCVLLRVSGLWKWAFAVVFLILLSLGAVAVLYSVALMLV